MNNRSDYPNMQTHFKCIAASITMLMFGMWSKPIYADQIPCISNKILIESSSRDNYIYACDAVKDAAHFFQSAGLPMPSKIVILLEDETSPLVNNNEIGHYNARLQTIVMKNYSPTTSRSKESETNLWSIKSLPFWKSYIVHELTHAAIHEGCDQTCPSREIHEYVAAVAQFSVLPEQYRSRILDKYHNLYAFENDSEITELYYALNPHYFAIKSYKHYQQLTNPKAYLKMRLSPRQ